MSVPATRMLPFFECAYDYADHNGYTVSVGRQPASEEGEYDWFAKFHVKDSEGGFNVSVFVIAQRGKSKESAQEFEGRCRDLFNKAVQKGRKDRIAAFKMGIAARLAA